MILRRVLAERTLERPALFFHRLLLPATPGVALLGAWLWNWKEGGEYANVPHDKGLSPRDAARLGPSLLLPRDRILNHVKDRSLLARHMPPDKYCQGPTEVAHTSSSLTIKKGLIDARQPRGSGGK